MSETVGDFVMQRLYAWKVRTIYGYPGDGINGFLGALGRASDLVRFVQVRHEELAAFMAAAHAKFSGEVGVCMATSGPGAIHLLNGLYDASMDNQPVVAIVGQQKRMSLGGDYQQEVDLQNLFKDVAHQFCQTCMHPAQARTLIDRAMRIAHATRSVTCVIFPNDVQEADAIEAAPREHGAIYTGIGYTSSRILPSEDELERAADILNRGKRVAILVGAGALHASAEVAAVADRLGAGVSKALLGKAVLPDDLPYVTGGIGLLGTKPSDLMMQNCDTLLMIGTSFPYSEWLPKEGQAKAVQIDISPRKLALRYPADVLLHGDAADTLRVLLPRLAMKTDRAWRQGIEAAVCEWWKLLESRALAPADLLNPQRVFWELSPRLPADCILTADSGSSTNWWARDLRIREGMMASLSGNLATMGPALPYALAAKFVHPDRPVVACAGDGAMQMNGNNVLIDVEKYWREWEDPRFVVLVLNNGDLNQVTWEQRVMAGDPKFNASQKLPEFSFATYAQSLGLGGIVMRKPEDIARGWDEAMALRRPVVVEAYTDPEVPPLPPHIEPVQAKNLVESIIKGDPRRWRVIKESARQLWAGLERVTK
ncbi:MAG: thiamine pyrophosphate-requiring protein [Kofleriaceae bacterium]|nr:thiamine pyrophosphate-requiring protein [Kofleriaceae bacterium]